jgi:large subunit ribosomal protein L28e
MSDSLLWELTKKNNSFLVKRDGLQLSSDPMNVANVHAFKYSGVNKKAVGVAVKDGKVVLSTKLGKSQVSKPKTQLSSVTLKSLSHTKKGNKAAKVP